MTRVCERRACTLHVIVACVLHVTVACVDVWLAGWQEDGCTVHEADAAACGAARRRRVMRVRVQLSLCECKFIKMQAMQVQVCTTDFVRAKRTVIHAQLGARGAMK